MTSPTSLDLTVFERILRTVASATAINQLCQKHSYKPRGGIYNVAVLVWLMIYQRLNAKGTRSSAVQFLARQAMSWQTSSRMGKRVREGRISTATGGYCQARLKMPTLVTNSVCEHIFQQLQVVMREQLPETRQPIFLIDGTTLRLSHSRELVKAFPPGRNQHGDNHWPTMLMVTFHDAHTGLATQPSWGPMYGKRAISEQSLASQALLPCTIPTPFEKAAKPSRSHPRGAMQSLSMNAMNSPLTSRAPRFREGPGPSDLAIDLRGHGVL